MKTTISIIAAVIALAGASQAALFLDDFSSDTSANYTATTTYGSAGASFSVNATSETLDVVGNSGSTYDVFHNTARLDIGETVSIDLISGADNIYLTISTTNRGPNTGTEDGIRLNWTGTGAMRGRIYNSGSGTDDSFAGAVSPSSLYITRDTDTSYTYGYDSTELATGVTIAGTAGIDMQVGIETFGSGTRAFDNLEITSVPEPSSAALLGLGGLALLRRRRK